MKTGHNLNLGQRVFCSGYIVKSGSHYETIDAKYTKDGVEHCTRCSKDGAAEEVEDWDSCSRYEIKRRDFSGVFVGETSRCTKIVASYEEPDYGRDRFCFWKEEPKAFAIVYYALGKKRLVPMDMICTTDDLFEQPKEENNG